MQKLTGRNYCDHNGTWTLYSYPKNKYWNHHHKMQHLILCTHPLTLCPKSHSLISLEIYTKAAANILRNDRLRQCKNQTPVFIEADDVIMTSYL